MKKNQCDDYRIKLLAVNSMITEKPISVNEIKKRLLEDYNMTADRKTIYRDITAITLFRNIQPVGGMSRRKYYDAGTVE